MEEGKEGGAGVHSAFCSSLRTGLVTQGNSVAGRHRVWQSVRSVSPAAGYFEFPLCGACVLQLFAFSSPKGMVCEAAGCLEECLTMCVSHALGGHWSW